MSGTVLVADDSGVVRAVVREQLTSAGFTVLEAVDGDQALTICRRELPDVALLDIDMPQHNGHQVLTELRAADETSHIPVVFLTGRVRVADAVEGLRLGAHDYLRKPVDGQELIARVSAALRVKRVEEQLRRCNQELAEASRRDALTGLYNRRHLGELMTTLARGREHQRRPTTVVMVDIDHLKRINDRYGHAAGDQTLRAVAALLGAAAGHVVGRWGGEEFLVVAPGTDLPEGSSLAERLRAAVGAAVLSDPDGRPLRVTVSVGCASGAGDPEDLVRLADQALDEAKSAGRNTVRVKEQAITDGGGGGGQLDAAVARIWPKSQERLGGRVTVLEEATDAELAGGLPTEQRRHAEEEAHKLAGSLGTFGMAEGSRLAREVELLLGGAGPVEAADALRLAELVLALRQQLDAGPAGWQPAPGAAADRPDGAP
jgi:diguanylate cyclase (GGDEF)-like protein